MQQMCDAMNNITDLDNESLFSAFHNTIVFFIFWFSVTSQSHLDIEALHLKNQ